MRDKWGHCGHFQCEYSHETRHGQKCVDLIVYAGGKNIVDMVVCDLGDGCLTKCLFAWTTSDKLRIKRESKMRFRDLSRGRFISI